MSVKGLVVVWVLFFLAIFGIGYITTGLVVTKLMNDFEVEQSQEN